MKPRTEPPNLDDRVADDLLAQLVQRIPARWPEWKAAVPADRERALALANDPADFGMTLLRLAARMGETILTQLNRVPHKTFLAFLDLVGIDLLPPRPARVPLTFTLVAKAPGDAVVPRGTRIGVAGEKDVDFETEEELVVVRARPRRACTLNPTQDRMQDLTGLLGSGALLASSVFRDSPTTPVWPPVDHVLYVSHPRLFSLAAEAKQPVELTMTWDRAPGALAWDYAGTGDEAWLTGTPTVGENAVIDAPHVVVTASMGLSRIGERVIEGYDTAGQPFRRSGSWVRATLRTPLPPEADPPKLLTLSASVNLSEADVVPPLAFANAFPMDLTKDFFPFGERPKFNDTFYIGCDAVLSKQGAEVTVQFALSDHVEAADSTTIELAWEYWDGDAWRPLPLAAGPQAVRTFLQGGTLTFTCPPMQPTTVNGEESRWLRVRIVAGEYGTEAEYQQTSSQELKDKLDALTVPAEQRDALVAYLGQRGLLDAFSYRPASFQPPSLKFLRLAYSYAEAVTTEFSIVAANGSVYRDVEGAPPWQPFVRAPELHPALYVGFDASPAKPVQGTPVSLYLQIVQPRYGEDEGTDETAVGGAPPEVVWRYWNGGTWARLPVHDDTDNLRHAGRVRFVGPTDLRTVPLFGEALLWLKASVERGSHGRPPKLGGLFMNTVWARHATTHRDQVLGSSNGEPGQVLAFRSAPVLTGQTVEVREPIVPPESEAEALRALEGPDAVRVERDEAGNVTAVWVRWHQVDTFSLSGPGDRHYVLDRMTGRLLFGDGARGRIPPAGRDNIKAARYQSGGGAAGNRGPGTVTELKRTIPFVAAVANHEAAAGGSDQEELTRVAARGPQQIKSRDRAVTTEDYEWLAFQASGEVARARCLPLTRMTATGMEADAAGWVTVIIVPEGSEEQPLPTEGLLWTVTQYLAARALVAMTPRIQVVGPSYTPVSVQAGVVPLRLDEARTVEARVLARLRTFLHPLRGGPDGTGWEFGRAVYLSEVASVVQGVEGVDQVQTISVSTGTGGAVPHVAVPPNGLPCSGEHRVTTVATLEVT